MNYLVVKLHTDAPAYNNATAEQHVMIAQMLKIAAIANAGESANEISLHHRANLFFKEAANLNTPEEVRFILEVTTDSEMKAIIVRFNEPQSLPIMTVFSGLYANK